MTKVRTVHRFMRKQNWQKAQDERILKAEGSLYRDNPDLLKDVKSLMTEEGDYLVARPAGVISNLREYGLMWDLNINICSRHRNPDKAVLLSIPVLETEGAFVREGKYISPKYANAIERQIGVESLNGGRGLGNLEGHIWDEGRSSGLNEASKQQHKIWDLLHFQYANSAVALTDYEHGQFKLPEVWLPQDTPTDKIKVLKILDEIK